MSRLASYHHGSLATALVEEGLAQVRERGAGKVSLRALATTIGVSPSAAYQHFGDKDDLLIAVGQRGFELLGERMRAGIAAVPGDDDSAAMGRLAATGNAYVGFAHAEPHLFRLMFGPLCRKPGQHGDAHDGSQHGDSQHDESPHDDEPGAYRILQQQLTELDRRGLLRVPADEALQLLIWSVVHGFSSLAIEGQIEMVAALPLFQVLQNLMLKDG